MVGAVGLSGPVHVELLEEERAQVVRLDTGRACTVERAALPAGVREGDVVVDGRLEPERTARRVHEVARKRALLAVPVPPGLDL
ncbi:DUF3006 domain-containing protein [Myxococcus sp. RHSTA-1-4]|uniref:DUF3006 domain-containing protein n=1 Tax=Myxococcus sp. RHSTA-1-4 TaxID=2874601 RepID=UPI001CBF9EEE|nr:DUF3006 domain-containing protein [Myxococcus sp. RHSTA-1-4]MBZ4418179.1 DUF3006 domain-containing protein [Myxococcus sp. RHSTA-1-4]